MNETRIGIPSHVATAIKKAGYGVATAMDAKVSLWWGWYRAENDWYSSSVTDGDTTYKVDRISIKPARMVCQEWANLILNEKTEISCPESEAVNALIEKVTDRGRFAQAGQGLIERAFALGTGAWALRFEGVDAESASSPHAAISIERYDARQIVPLSYSDDDCTECAFVSTTTIRGKVYDQLQIHRIGENDTYVIETQLFSTAGRPLALDDVAPSFDTKSKVPTFALVRPGIENTYWDYSPTGVSVFDDALGAVQLVDEAVDNMHRDIHLGQMMVFIAEDLLTHDKNGKVVVPRAQDQQLFRKMEATSASNLIEQWAPDLRVEQNATAINKALSLLGFRTGFGLDYWSWDAQGGLKTATEVVSDNSQLFRSVRKHENVIAPALSRIFTALATCTRTVAGDMSIPEEIPAITVNFDDSVITDSASERAQDLQDVASGIMKPWEYRVKWYGDSEEDAKAITETDGDVFSAPLP